MIARYPLLTVNEQLTRFLALRDSSDKLVAPADFEYKGVRAVLNTEDYDWTLTLNNYKISFIAVDNPFVFVTCFKEIYEPYCTSISFPYKEF